MKMAGFSATLDKVIAASPDRIALYSYAHVPHLFKPQRRIDVDALPAPETKLAILALAIEKLGTAGYLYIGMDHFAKPGEELAVAQDFELDFAALGAQYGIAFADYFAPDLAALGPLATDGLVVLTDRDLKVTMRGRLLVRTVAMHFDRYLREAQQKAQYSRVI